LPDEKGATMSLIEDIRATVPVANEGTIMEGVTVDDTLTIDPAVREWMEVFASGHRA